MNSPDQLQLRRLFQKAAPPSFFLELTREHGYRFRDGIYSSAVVVWLMIWQRLQGPRNLEAAVQHLLSTSKARATSAIVDPVSSR